MKAPSVPLAVLSCLLLCRSEAVEPEYARVSFQGRLSMASAPLPDGAYDMVFNFYDTATNGTVLFTDRHVGPANSVVLSGGLFTVLLGGGETAAGSESNLWSVFLNHPQVYLGISVASEPEMTPRRLLTRTPYAVRAEDALTLSGKTASQFLDATADSQTKSGQLMLSVTSSTPALIAMNRGGGPLIQAQSPSGAIVFNVANNGSLSLAGNASITGNVTTAGSYRFSPAKTNRITLGPADFKPRHPTEEAFILWGYPWKTNRHYLICTRETGFTTFHADVHLPEGATLTKLVSYIYDVDAGRSSLLNLARCSLFGHLGPDPVYLATNTSVDNQIRVEHPLVEVVNTSTNHYVLSLQLYWSELGMQFFGAQVEYTYTELKN
jgi:hypothetical protein